MTMPKVQIESTYDQTKVTWTASTTSSEVALMPGRTYSIYVDAAFIGTKLFVESWVEYEGKAGAWVRRAGFGADSEIAIVDDRVNYVPSTVFSGIKQVRFVSDQTETCAGLVLINS